MKKMVLLLFAVCLALCMTIPAFAQEVDTNPEQEIPSQGIEAAPVAVSTLEELKNY